MYKKILSLLLASAALLTNTSACDMDDDNSYFATDGDSCSKPGFTRCNYSKNLMVCNDERVFEKTESCDYDEKCVDDGQGNAECYEACSSNELGTVKFIHDGSKITKVTCTDKGYTSKQHVWVYSNYPCEKPGTSICEGDFVYYCNDDFEYEVEQNCNKEVCREHDDEAGCYTTCLPKETGNEKYSCSSTRQTVTVATCKVFPGYEDKTPVWAYNYDSYLSHCSSSNTQIYCEKGKLKEYTCSVVPAEGKTGVCKPYAESYNNSQTEAECQ